MSELHEGEWVRVYRNRHRQNWSVQARTEKGWRVVAHLDHLRLFAFRFHVSEAGRQRALRTRTRNVHAYAEGCYTRSTYRVPNSELVSVGYNPFRGSTFVNRDTGEPVHSGVLLICDPSGCGALGVH